VLSPSFEPGEPCILDTDASDVAVGAVLSQKIQGVERPIAFFSRVMNVTQRNYCTTRRELLAAVMAFQHFRHYLLGIPVILRTDHASLKWLHSLRHPEGILARWLETLQEFQITIEHRPGKQHSNVDGISRPFCKQCWAKGDKCSWVDEARETEELERADEIADMVGPTSDVDIHDLSHMTPDNCPDVRRITFLPEMSDDDIAVMQAEDDELGPVIEWLKHGETPSPDDLRTFSLNTRKLWDLVPMIHLCSDVLVYRPNDDSELKLVVPFALHRKLFDMNHSGPLAAHLGSHRMTQALRANFYWMGMRRDVEQWCKECETCAKGHGPPSRGHGTLQKVQTGAPMDIVAIDILSGLPTTKDGSKYILVVTDYFTKWTEAYPLPDAEASTCLRVLYNQFFSRFGLPRQLHSDMGRNFESNLFKELCQLVGTHKSHTTAFNAKCDGQSERSIRSLLQML